MAEIVERETEAWYKMDPDPFDDRHPGIKHVLFGISVIMAHMD